MSTQTTNYGFIKDDEDEFYNVLRVNSNLDKIDTKLKEIDNKASNITVPVTSVNNKTGDVVLKAADIKAADNKTIEEKFVDVVTQMGEKTNKTDYVANTGYAVSSGTPTAYTVSLNPAPTAYVDGQQFIINPHVECGASPTLNVNNLGALTILNQDGSAIEAGDIKANKPLSLVRVGSNFFIRSSGVSLNGSQAIKVFVQTAQPIANTVGDIWVKSDKGISNIFFQETEPGSPQNLQGFVKIGGVTNLVVNIKNGMKFIKRSETQMIIEYPTMLPLSTTATNFIKIWKNAYMDLYVKLGAFKYYDSGKAKWVYEWAFYWNGVEWVKFSQNDYGMYFTYYYDLYPNASTLYKRVGKLNFDGTLAWENNSYTPLLCATDGFGNVVIHHRTDDTVTKISKIIKFNGNGVQLWEYSIPNGNPVTELRCGADGSVYFFMNTGTTANIGLYKLNSDGSLQWFMAKLTYSMNSIMILPNGNIYVHTTSGSSGFLNIFDKDGVAIGTQIALGVYKFGKMMSDGQYLYFRHSGTSDAGGIHKFTLDGKFIATISNYYLTDAVISNDGYIYAYNNSVNKIWKINTTNLVKDSEVFYGDAYKSVKIDIDVTGAIHTAGQISASTRSFRRCDNGLNIEWEYPIPSGAQNYYIACEPADFSTHPHLW